MAGYVKNVAVIKGLKDGFSADGGELSGLVKCEKYGSVLRVEVVRINFAPLSEGKYVCAVTDGKFTRVFEGENYEGAEEMDTSRGFAAEIFYVKDGVYPVAYAICGSFHSAALALKEEVEKAENISAARGEESDKKAAAYEDEALAEENYYDYEQNNESGGAVCEDTQKEDDGQKSCENEEDTRPFTPPLAHGEYFYKRMKAEIDGLLAAYPHEEGLESLIENSRWVRIDYGEGKYYVFGVISEGGAPRYICYGVPAETPSPPDSLKGLASLIPVQDGGYWVMYQDAFTGASIKAEAE